MNRNTLAAPVPHRFSLPHSRRLRLRRRNRLRAPPRPHPPPAASGAPSGGVEDGACSRWAWSAPMPPTAGPQMDDSNGAVPVSNVPGPMPTAMM